MNDRPFKRTYARLELERRFRLPALPAGIASDKFVRLRDLFVTGTGLRIRTVENEDGVELVTKVGQKLPDPAAPDQPGRNLLTTIYLPPDQSAPLRSLPGCTSCKRRYTFEEQGWTWAIDVWEEPDLCAGLILAEVECPDVEQLAQITMPSWAEEEVSQSVEYSAFELASRGLA